jgi:tight adherence protein B
MFDSQFAAIALTAVAAGAVAYVFIYPLMSGDARAEKRQKALMAPNPDRRERVTTVNRKDQVAQSLKEIEAKQKARHKISLEARIAQAGLTWSKQRYYIMSALIGLGLGTAVLLVSQNPLTACGAAFVGGFGVPRWILGYITKRRISRFIIELPNAVDVIVRGIRSGLPLGDCMRIVASEAKEPVRSEFRVIMEAQAVGITMGEAVGKLFERVPVAEANFFGIVIAIQQKSGGNLSEALGNLSKVLRERRKMADKIKAMSMEAKASAGIIGSLPPIVGILTYLSSPDYISLLWTTTTGKFALVAGALWMCCGIITMKKMVSFKF